jgi:hypothetical protein
MATGTALPDSHEIPVRAKRPASPRETTAPRKPKSLSAAASEDPLPALLGAARACRISRRFFFRLCLIAAKCRCSIIIQANVVG